MKNWLVRFFYLGALFTGFTHSAQGGQKFDSGENMFPRQPMSPHRFQNLLWVLSFISLLLPIFIFEKREKEYAAKQVSIPLKHLTLHPSAILSFMSMVIIYAAFMAVDFYSPCTPEMWFVYFYIFTGIMWLAMLQPVWLYLSILKVEKFYIVKAHSLVFYENNRPLFDRWAKWLAFGLAVFLAAISLASFYYMDRLNWSNCQLVH